MSTPLNFEKFRSELKRRIELLKTGGKCSSQSVGSSRVSGMTSLTKSDGGSSEQRYEAEMRMLLSALRRIETTGYGLCLMCGDDIPVKRLSADPAVPTCLHCSIKAG